MVKAVFSSKGFPEGFYMDEIHGENIPTGAVYISHSQWKEFIENVGVRIWDGANVVIYHPDPPEPLPSTPELYAIADISIEDGAMAISSVTTSAQISAVFYIDVGTYWVFFAEAQPNTSYIPLCYNHNHTVFVSEKTEDFFVVTALSGGSPSDPTSLSVEVKRVQ